MRSFVESQPGVPAWRSASGLCLAEMGREDEARAELATIAPDGVDEVPSRGNLWIIGNPLFVDVTYLLGEPRTPRTCYDTLLPFGHAFAGIAAGIDCLGSDTAPPRRMRGVARAVGHRRTRTSSPGSRPTVRRGQ